MLVTVIGLGGVGSILVERLSRFLSSNQQHTTVQLVDGDIYERKNFARQEFIDLGKKAVVKQSELSRMYRNINFVARPEYVSESNVHSFIQEHSFIFLCVDNHKSRKIVNNYCKTLNDVVLISGGNELVDGNVQIYIRREGQDLTPDLCTGHPEIENARDKTPEEMSCQELSISEPQLYFTNLGVATIMCWSFYNILNNDNFQVSEVYFDITKMKVSPKIRRKRRK